MNKFPFTATQWQELEHQALIFKYMVSGIPIPPDLLYTLRRNCLDSSNNKFLISHHSQHVGWNFFQAGLGRKIDPEPGRCRRTDGKKWRCSKEAFPDSKYCERHMHRGKNRSRKPVEVFKTQHNTPPVSNNNNNNNDNNNNNNNNDNNNIRATSSPMLTNLHHFDQNPPPFTYHHNNNNNNTASFVFDSDLRHRYVYGVKDEVDEHSFFSQEPSRRTGLRGFSSNTATPMDDTWQLTPLTISCSNHSSSSCSKLQSGGGGGGHYYHHDKNDMGEEVEEDGTQKTTRHFFDEWPMKQKDSSSWLDLDEKSVSTTQLSISVPTKPSHDFPIFNSRTR